MLYLPRPDPDRFLPWKLGERPGQPPDLFAPELIALPPNFTVVLDIQPPITPMSRKFDRTKRIHQTANEIAFETLKASVRMKPWYIPVFIWRPIYWLAAKIVFK